jgi:hypothetical protein
MGRALIHVPVGALNAWFISRDPVLGAIFFICFIVYELAEDWRIRDQAFRDIIGYQIGLAICSTALLLTRNPSC